MAKVKTNLQRASGKLTSSVQKIWVAQGGETNSDFSLDVLDAAQLLTGAKDLNAILVLLQGRTVRQYLGEVWVHRFPSVKPEIDALEAAIRDELSSGS